MQLKQFFILQVYVLPMDPSPSAPDLISALWPRCLCLMVCVVNIIQTTPSNIHKMGGFTCVMSWNCITPLRLWTFKLCLSISHSSACNTSFTMFLEISRRRLWLDDIISIVHLDLGWTLFWFYTTTPTHHSAQTFWHFRGIVGAESRFIRHPGIQEGRKIFRKIGRFV